MRRDITRCSARTSPPSTGNVRRPRSFPTISRALTVTTTMIDAAGLGALISVALAAQASQCSVELAAPGNLIRQLLELTKLTSVFEVHPLDAATVASRGQAA